MGFSFLILTQVTSLAALVVVLLLLFVLGEMLWVPVSQTIAAAMAPSDLRGAYMGAFGSSSAVDSPSARSLPSSFAAPRGTMRCGSSWRRCHSWPPP